MKQTYIFAASPAGKVALGRKFVVCGPKLPFAVIFLACLIGLIKKGD